MKRRTEERIQRNRTEERGEGLIKRKKNEYEKEQKRTMTIEKN